MKIFLSPHDDDHALFGAFICIREKPIVIVCLDSWIQPNRGETGCSAAERAAETEAASKILGCRVRRLGLRDDLTDFALLLGAFKVIAKGIEESAALGELEAVYAPAFQGGNIHHDMVSLVADRVFGERVIHYTTYTKSDLHTAGDSEVEPTVEELGLKAQALACYPSQLRINRPHFDAVLGKSEWLLA